MSVSLDQVAAKSPDSWNSAPHHVGMPQALIPTLKGLQTRTQLTNDDPEARTEFGLFVVLHNGVVTLPPGSLVQGSGKRSSGTAAVNMGPRLMPGYSVIGTAHSHPVSDRVSTGDVSDFLWKADRLSFLSSPKHIWMMLRTKKTDSVVHQIPPAPRIGDLDPLQRFDRARAKAYGRDFGSKAEAFASVDVARIFEIALYRLDEGSLLKKIP